MCSSYYLDFTASLKQWQMSLYRGDSATGDKVLTMACKPLQTADFTIRMLPSGWTTQLQKPPGSTLVSTALSFRGFDRSTYTWTCDGGWKSDVRWTVRLIG